MREQSFDNIVIKPVVIPQVFFYLSDSDKLLYIEIYSPKGGSDLKSEIFHIIQYKILIKRLRIFYKKSKIINKIINVNI